jgi:energy-coupling factor transporter ATP-binding protein EcfA2
LPILFEIRSVEDLGLPEVVTNLAEEQGGIILVTGTTGSGKSTTLAAMIDHINRTRSHHTEVIAEGEYYGMRTFDHSLAASASGIEQLGTSAPDPAAAGQG